MIYLESLRKFVKSARMANVELNFTFLSISSIAIHDKRYMMRYSPSFYNFYAKRLKKGYTVVFNPRHFIRVLLNCKVGFFC